MFKLGMENTIAVPNHYSIFDRKEKLGVGLSAYS